MKHLKYTLLYWASVWALIMLFFSLFRVGEYAILHEMIGSATGAEAAPSHLEAFGVGLQFDNTIACYIMALPLLALLIGSLCRCRSQRLLQGVSLWAGILGSIAFMASAANIPYFRNFVKNINAGVLEWLDDADTAVGMALEDRSLVVYVLLFVGVVVVYVYLLRRLRLYFSMKLAESRAVRRHWGKELSVSVVGLGLCVLGMRGSLGQLPINASAAYYCNDAFLNQLGINPTFNFMYSLKERYSKKYKTLGLMPNDEALAIARRELGVSGDYDPAHPLRRYVSNEPKGYKPNVVLIFMETMSANYMQYGGQKKRLTPVLDSLCHVSLMYDHFYSSGIHTNQGITSVLFSFPALMQRNMMKTIEPKRIGGLPEVLEKEGYKNLMFIPHDSHYDNINGFVRNNGMHDIYDRYDYPAEARVNNFGVSDHFLFDFSLPVLRKEAESGRPFFASILTVSNHMPFVVPDSFETEWTDMKDKIVAWCDWCIGDFLRKAQAEPWYENTIFVLVADHGGKVGEVDAELPQSFNHIPLLILGKGVPHGIDHRLGMQVDIMPTLLDLMGVSYTYDGFGKNLLKERRDKVYYAADSQIAGRDAHWLNVFTPSMKREVAYEVMGDGGLKARAVNDSCRALQAYSVAMTQAAQYVYLK